MLDTRVFMVCVAHEKYLEMENNLPRTFFSKPYVLNPRTISNTARNVCCGKTRKENALLLRKIDAFKEELRTNLTKHQEEKCNLQQIVFHLNCQREGMTKKVSKYIERSTPGNVFVNLFLIIDPLTSLIAVIS